MSFELLTVGPLHCGIRTFPLRMHYLGKNRGKKREGAIGFCPKQTRSYFSGPEPLCRIS